MTQRDRWQKRPAVLRYRAFCDELRLRVKSLPEEFAVSFNIRMPDSWSEKKKLAMDGQPHRAKPDIDNMLKAVMDALFDDDSGVHSVHMHKRWAREGSIFFAPGVRES